jgi:hypothetical protein
MVGGNIAYLGLFYCRSNYNSHQGRGRLDTWNTRDHVIHTIGQLSTTAFPLLSKHFLSVVPTMTRESKHQPESTIALEATVSLPML